MPQQYARPTESTAQTWLSPALMSTRVFPCSTPLVDTATGAHASEPLPSPSCPNELPPQQYALPTSLMAQVKYSPTVMAISFLPDSTPDVSTAQAF